MKFFTTFFFIISLPVFASSFREKAPAVAEAVKKNLMGNLGREIAENGTLKAVEFCHLNVKRLGQESAVKYNGMYEFGRASHKVRNPQNAPQDWQIAYLEKFKDKKQGSKDSEAFFHTTKEGVEVYLEPLWVAPMCLQCHGGNVAKNVKDEIIKRYPKDQALGFKVGDFRGFIWVKEKDLKNKRKAP